MGKMSRTEGNMSVSLPNSIKGQVGQLVLLPLKRVSFEKHSKTTIRKRIALSGF